MCDWRSLEYFWLHVSWLNMTCMFFFAPWAVTDLYYGGRKYLHWRYLEVGSLAKGWNLTGKLFSIWHIIGYQKLVEVRLNKIGGGVEQIGFIFFDGVVTVLTIVWIGNNVWQSCIGIFIFVLIWVVTIDIKILVEFLTFW